MGADLLHTFRFELSFESAPLAGGDDAEPPVDGAFAECTGLEATMEPKVIKSGGSNWGAFQRVGPVTFATVVLKRGISRGAKLFRWFERVASGDHGHRCTVWITLKAPPTDAGENETAMTWVLRNAMPVKFKAADFNARATEVGIEELHLVHEGLSLETGSRT